MSDLTQAVTRFPLISGAIPHEKEHTLKQNHSFSQVHINMRKQLLDEKSNKKIVGTYTYGALGVVAIIMTIMNAITNKGFLTYCTGAFAALCLLEIICVWVIPHGVQIASVLFSAAILAMFTFFLISGNPDGFSALWICMLPSLGMFFFGRKFGSVLCTIMFGDLVFLLWTPLGQSFLRYDYNPTFRMRFPFLFVAFFVVAVLLEVLRFYTYEEMVNLETRYRNLSVRDTLTGMLNRQGLFSEIKNVYPVGNSHEMCFAMLDIDHFKWINDKYGHAAGDAALAEFARIVRDNVGDNVCRWGGEEFLVFASDSVAITAAIEKVRHTLETTTFQFEDTELSFTVSAGIRYEDNFDPSLLDIYIQEADKALYEAKQSGRNKIIVFDPSMANNY